MEYSIEEIEPYGAMIFTRVFKVKADSVTEDGYEEMVLWCCENLQEPFVLIVYKTRIVAGGTSDNKNSYFYRKEEGIANGELISYYELRCGDKDAVLFKVRWS